MASIKNLKKEINYVFGDIIDSVFHWEYTSGNFGEGSELTLEILVAYDELIEKIYHRNVENRGTHLKQVRKDFEQKAGAFIGKLNKLS
ncbi:hypothetical protein [Capnocytophaga stomatis]|uniref:hypothetical protein n=1 Tax=Capnocytophaga stomatis TaxID=1848904 RepID=UPI0019528E90|nr:hypothetical protein [Capnocytophaga stomatis]